MLEGLINVFPRKDGSGKVVIDMDEKQFQAAKSELMRHNWSQAEVKLSIPGEIKPQRQGECEVTRNFYHDVEELFERARAEMSVEAPDIENQALSVDMAGEGKDKTVIMGHLSDCCGEPVVVDGSDEGTMHYECSKCGEPCGVRERE